MSTESVKCIKCNAHATWIVNELPYCEVHAEPRAQWLLEHEGVVSRLYNELGFTHHVGYVPIMNVTEHTKSLYSILDGAARSWWYHKELRARGEHEEARHRERASIRDKVRVLRECIENHGFAITGRGGWTIHYEHRSRLMHPYSGMNEPMMRACVLVGIPVLDSSTIPDERIHEVLKFPMPSTHPDPKPPGGEYKPMDYAPAIYVFTLYEALGATVYNWETLMMWNEPGLKRLADELGYEMTYVIPPHEH